MVRIKKGLQINNIKKCYMEYSYWENKIIKEANLWNGYFEKNEITNESIIVYTGIFNLDKDILKNGWVVYPDIHTFLGFLQYVFIPTVYFNWFDKNEEEFLIPISNFNIVVNEITKYNGSSYNSRKMEYFYYKLEELWYKSNDELINGVNEFIEEFNETWNEYPNKRLFIKYFNNGNDIYNFIKDSLVWDFDEFVEEEINMTLEELKDTCENILNEPVINNKIIHLLNNNVINLF